MKKDDGPSKGPAQWSTGAPQWAFGVCFFEGGVSLGGVILRCRGVGVFGASTKKLTFDL